MRSVPLFEVSSVLGCRLCSCSAAQVCRKLPLLMPSLPRYRRSAYREASGRRAVRHSPLQPASAARHQLQVTDSVKPLGQQGDWIHVHWASTDTALLTRDLSCASARLAPLLSAARRSPQKAPAAHAAASAREEREVSLLLNSIALDIAVTYSWKGPPACPCAPLFYQ